jgi:hypothetical protein
VVTLSCIQNSCSHEDGDGKKEAVKYAMNLDIEIDGIIPLPVNTVTV